MASTAANKARLEKARQDVSEMLDKPKDERPPPPAVAIRQPGLNFRSWLSNPYVMLGAFAGSLCLFYFGLRWWFGSGRSSSIGSNSAGASVVAGSPAGDATMSGMQRQALELARRVMQGQTEIDQVIGQANRAMASALAKRATA